MTGDGVGIEIEVKLHVRSVEEALGRLTMLPASLEESTRFEDNEIYDTPERTLADSHRLLRLRVVGGRAVMTYKEKVDTEVKAKVRTEVESTVGSADAVRAMLEKLGFVRTYRYQKYRSYHGWRDPESGENLMISVDRTPIGVYMELEGAKASIDRAAAMLGYSEEDYILDDYRSLHHAWLEERGLAHGDMVFDDPDPGDGRRAAG